MQKRPSRGNRARSARVGSTRPHRWKARWDAAEPLTCANLPVGRHRRTAFARAACCAACGLARRPRSRGGHPPYRPRCASCAPRCARRGGWPPRFALRRRGTSSPKHRTRPWGRSGRCRRCRAAVADRQQLADAADRLAPPSGAGLADGETHPRRGFAPASRLPASNGCSRIHIRSQGLAAAAAHVVGISRATRAQRALGAPLASKTSAGRRPRPCGRVAVFGTLVEKRVGRRLQSEPESAYIALGVFPLPNVAEGHKGATMAPNGAQRRPHRRCRDWLVAFRAPICRSSVC